MNQGEFVEAISEKIGTTKQPTGAILSAFMDTYLYHFIPKIDP